MPVFESAKAAVAAKPAETPKGHGHGHGGGQPPSAARTALLFGVAAALFWFIGANAPAAFLSHFTVFVLACFVGYMVVWNVTPSLHTPLMSVTNAISSVVIVGALLAAGSGTTDASAILGTIAVGIVAINIFGGFLVSQRMLEMFKKKDTRKH